MKKTLKALLAIGSIFTMINTAQATVDGLTSAWIVTQDFQEEDDFKLIEVPVSGCWGVAQGPELTQFTSKYEVTASMGCGGSDTYKDDLNALSCGILISAEENDQYSGFKKIVLDISSCKHKNNDRFITLVRTAAARNFPQTKDGKIIPGKEVELVLMK